MGGLLFLCIVFMILDLDCAYARTCVLFLKMFCCPQICPGELLILFNILWQSCFCLSSHEINIDPPKCSCLNSYILSVLEPISGKLPQKMILLFSTLTHSAGMWMKAIWEKYSVSYPLIFLYFLLHFCILVAE